MDAVLEYLTQNPLIALAFLVVAVAIVFTVAKKLFKAAVVLLVVFLVAGGTVFHISRQEVMDAGSKVWEEGKELGKDVIKKGTKAVKEQLATPDTMRPTGTPDTLKPSRRKHRSGK